MIQGLRLTLLLNYIIHIVCFLNAFSLFFGLYFLFVQFSEPANLKLTWPLGFCGGLFAITGMMLALTLREKTWIKIFHIEELVDSTLSAPEATAKKEEEKVEIEKIKHIVEQVLASKRQANPTKKNRRKN